MSRPRRKRPEQEFQDSVVIPALQRLGYLCYHAFDPRRSTAGLPDIIAAPPLHRPDWPVLALELKVGKNTLSDAQLEWLARLDNRDVFAREMRPETMAALLAEAVPDLS